MTRTLVELADTLVDDFDVVDLMTMVVDRCVEILDVSAAGLMLVAPEGDLRLGASSSEAARVVELFELQSEEGPCLDCHRSGELIGNAELTRTADDRWPAFAPVARGAGFQMVHAIPMRLRTTNLGALNMFQTEAHAIGGDDLQSGQALADMATIAILQYRAAVEARVLNQQRQAALNSRIVIEQAKGMLAERAGIQVAQAFDRLRSYARSNNLRLVDVAQGVLGGVLPSETFPPPTDRS
ncbi:MAG TPA: GAF and ANTAR domain-containing protein [Acidimicrobiales bacterium]|nr:GAF and ANTAR domain-containing protein [Acidimicrobiales bacterium]